DHRLVVDGHELLGNTLGDGVEPGAGAACEDDAFHLQLLEVIVQAGLPSWCVKACVFNLGEIKHGVQWAGCCVFASEVFGGWHSGDIGRLCKHRTCDICPACRFAGVGEVVGAICCTNLK